MTTHSDPEDTAAGRPIDRRREDRVPFKQICTYELCEPVESNKIAIHQGKVLSHNISSKGILLEMDKAPQIERLLEVRMTDVQKRKISTVLEVRWTRQVPDDVLGTKYLVGGRFQFGPYSLGNAVRSQKKRAAIV